MCTVVDLPTKLLASLFAPLMFAGLHNQSPLLTTLALALTNTIWSTVEETQCTLALVGAICIHTGSMPLTLILFIAALIIV